MARFSFRFFAFIMILFVGIFLGITVAEKGIYKVAGTPDQGIQSFQVSKKENQVEVKVLGKTYTKPIPGSEPKTEINKPVQKDKPNKPEAVKTNQNKPKESVEQPVSGSFMSKVGNAIGSTLQTGAEKGFQMISNMID